MAYQPLEDLLPKAGNSIYRLVLLGSKRATELAEGMPRLIERPSEIKTTTLALDEIIEGKVVLKGCEKQAVLAQESKNKEGKEIDEDAQGSAQEQE